VHEVRELKRGGAIIRTLSQAEMSKLVVSAKFAEVGLKVSRNTAARPRVTVQDVDTSVGPDEFMMELKEKNFGEMSLKEFQKVVVLATKPWSAADGATVNVTLEVDDQALAVLEGGRLYVKWFSYRCRSQVRTYDTDASDLTTRSATVSTPERNRSAASGQNDHVAAKCRNAVDCRNCRHKGMPSGHYMLSGGCPIYGALLARVQARH